MRADKQIPEIMASVMGTVNELVSFAAAMADVKFKGDEVRVGYIQAYPVCGYLLFLAYNGGPVGKVPVVRL